MIEGTKLDQNKPRWDLLPPGPVAAVVDVLTYGAIKYAPGNWQKVSDARDRYYAAALRHLIAWRQGEPVDGESRLPHLAHAACCLLFLLWFDDEGIDAGVPVQPLRPAPIQSAGGK